MNSTEELPKLCSMKASQRQHPLPIIKSKKEISVNIIKESNENNADELILTQIAEIRNSLSSEAYSTDSTNNLRILPLLVEHIQKNQNPHVIIELLELFISMCSTNPQYTLRLCRLRILDTIKIILDGNNAVVKEHALMLLSHIIKEFVSPTKAFSKCDQCENEIRQTLVGSDFISRLIHMITDTNSSDKLINIAFSCLSQYTSKIYISQEDCKSILRTINYYINTTYDSELLINMCTTISRHFVIAERVMLLVSSCVVPNLVHLLDHQNYHVVSSALHTVGLIIAIERDETMPVDYTEYVVDCGVIEFLISLLHSNNIEIIKETCWTISNIVAGTSEQIDAIIQSNCVPQIIELTKTRWLEDIKNEVNWVFLNGTTCGKDEQVDYFVQNGVISFFMDVIYDDDKYKETFDALEFIQQVGDRQAKLKGTTNPYVPLINIKRIKEISEMPPCDKQKCALAFFTNYYRFCGICRQYYYIADIDWHFCKECNCYVCNSCDCTIYHLDYQLAYWDDGDEKKPENKKKPKRKKKTQTKSISTTSSLQPTEMEVFNQRLEQYLLDYDILKLSKLLRP